MIGITSFLKIFYKDHQSHLHFWTTKQKINFNKHFGGFCEVRTNVMFLSIPLFFNFIEMKQQKLLMEKDPQFKKKMHS